MILILNDRFWEESYLLQSRRRIKFPGLRYATLNFLLPLEMSVLSQIEKIVFITDEEPDSEADLIEGYKELIVDLNDQGLLKKFHVVNKLISQAAYFKDSELLPGNLKEMAESWGVISFSYMVNVSNAKLLSLLPNVKTYRVRNRYNIKVQLLNAHRKRIPYIPPERELSVELVSNTERYLTILEKYLKLMPQPNEKGIGYPTTSYNEIPNLSKEARWKYISCEVERFFSEKQYIHYDKVHLLTMDEFLSNKFIGEIKDKLVLKDSEMGYYDCSTYIPKISNAHKALCIAIIERKSDRNYYNQIAEVIERQGYRDKLVIIQSPFNLTGNLKTFNFKDLNLPEINEVNNIVALFLLFLYERGMAYNSKLPHRRLPSWQEGLLKDVLSKVQSVEQLLTIVQNLERRYRSIKVKKHAYLQRRRVRSEADMESNGIFFNADLYYDLESELIKSDGSIIEEKERDLYTFIKNGAIWSVEVSKSGKEHFNDYPEEGNIGFVYLSVIVLLWKEINKLGTKEAISYYDIRNKVLQYINDDESRDKLANRKMTRKTKSDFSADDRNSINDALKRLVVIAPELKEFRGKYIKVKKGEGYKFDEENEIKCTIKGFILPE
jgi:hypothetical protein